MVIVFSVSLAILVLRFGTRMLDENFVSDVSTHYGSAAEFLSFYGLLNFYIYTMAFVYSPSKNALTGKLCILSLGILKEWTPLANSNSKQEVLTLPACQLHLVTR